MKTPMALSVTSSQREQTSLRFQVPRLPRSNVCSTRDLENPSASVHLKRFSTPSLTLKFLCAGKLNPRTVIGDEEPIQAIGGSRLFWGGVVTPAEDRQPRRAALIAA